MKFGLNQETLKVIQEVLADHPKVEQAVLYGSRAIGNFRYNSDLDLTLKGEKLSLTEQLAIENELDDLLFPDQIDLSIFEHIDHQDLRDHINSVGKVFL